MESIDAESAKPPLTRGMLLAIRLTRLMMSSKCKRMSGQRVIAQLLAISVVVIALGVGVSLEARSIETAAALVHQSVQGGVPEAAELFAVGMVLVGIAASTRRVIRRRHLRDHAAQCQLQPATSLAR
jgi:hypothetical protein